MSSWEKQMLLEVYSLMMKMHWHPIVQKAQHQSLQIWDKSASGKLFNNATEDNLITGVTVGLFNIEQYQENYFQPYHQRLGLKQLELVVGISRVVGETLVCLTSNS